MSMPGLLLAAVAALPGASWASTAQQPPVPAPIELTAEERAFLASHGPLRFVTEPAYPPIEWFDEQGNYRGMVAEYFRLIEARLGVRIEIQQAPSWDEAMRRARSREADGLTAAQPTPERSEAFDWTPPVLRIPSVIVVRAGMQGDFTLDALAGKRVAVSSGNALHEHLRAAHPGVEIAPQADDLAALLAVSFGRADAAVLNLAVASYLIEQHGINNLRVAGDTGRQNVLAIATGKHQPLLGTILAKGLAAVTPAEREAIQSRWLGLQSGHLVPWRSAVRWGAAALIGLLAISLLVVAWNRVLRREVVRATNRLQQEFEERRRAEDRFRALIENAVDMIALLDEQGRLQFASPSLGQNFGRSADELVGKPILDLVHPEDRARVRRSFAAIAGRPGATARFEGLMSRGDGTWRRVEGGARNLLLNPSVRGLVVNARDVTEQRQAEELVRQTQKLESVGRLAGGLAHDFNNLLTVILSGAHELKCASAEGARADPAVVEDIGIAGERARGLTSQLLAFARKQVVAPVPLDLNAVLRGSEDMLRRMLGEDVDVEVILQPGLWSTLCDPVQVEQVVLNLAVNARDAMPGGGKLVIETRNSDAPVEPSGVRPDDEPGQWVRLAVRDFGSGMTPETKAHLFEPFFTTKARGKGTGLGLAIVHGIVHQAGGHLHIESEVGRGTTFQICFPRHEGDPMIVDERLESTPTGGTEVILVAEDEPSVRALAVRTLQNEGYRVVTARNGQEVRGLRDEEVGRLQLLVTDVVMPGQNGREVAEELRRRNPGLPVLYVSGYAADAFADGSSLDARSAFLAKPFTAPDLLRRVRELLDRAGPVEPRERPSW